MQTYMQALQENMPALQTYMRAMQTACAVLQRSMHDHETCTGSQ